MSYTRHARCQSRPPAWVKLQARATGSGATCDHPRFVDNGDGTVTDNLTALQWEKKTNLDGTPNLADPHDADNAYPWSNGGVGSTAADGTAFTDFLATLNGGGCFTGQCDWRLPTREEYRTIVSPLGPACTAPPCIYPVFGPQIAYTSWSATTVATDPTAAWYADFLDGYVGNNFKWHAETVRAVRGGL